MADWKGRREREGLREEAREGGRMGETEVREKESLVGKKNLQGSIRCW
jgi:hypothetical protein